MSRRIIYIVALIAMWCTDVVAQKYYVYQFEGNVCVQQGRKLEPVTMRQCLDGEQNLSVDEGASVKLLDMSTRKFTVLRGKCQGKVSELSADEKDIIDISKEYLTYVYNQLFCRQPISRHSSEVAAVYRDLEGMDSDIQIADSAPSLAERAYYVYQTLYVTTGEGDEQRMVEPRQMLLIDEEVELGDSSKIKIFAPEEKLFILVGKSGKYTVRQLLSDKRHKKTHITDERFIKVCDQVFGGQPIGKAGT